MVAHLLRLRLDLLAGALRGPGRARARWLGALALLVVATGVACVAILSLSDAPVERTRTMMILIGSALVLACMVGPILLSMPDALDPRRFRVFGLSARALAPALALAGLVSIPVLALLTVLVCVALVWIAHGVAPGVVVGGTIAAFATCVLAARCSLALGSLVFRARRSRELSGVLVLVLLVVIVPVAVFLLSAEWGDGVPVSVADFVDALALTPWGAAWALPGATGRPGGTIWAIGAVAVLTVALLGVAWTALVTRALTRTERPAGAGEHAGLGWFALLPGTAAGAIAARSLIYWLRDRRHLVNILIIPLAAALPTIPLLVAGVPVGMAALLPVPIVALFLGWLPHNDIAYDSTAIWMHLASGVRGIADRVGRLAPVLLIGIPLLAVVIPIAAAVHGSWGIVPALIGVAASLFLTGVGLSSIASAISPYPVARPGDSPFQQPQRSGSAGAIAPALVMVGTLVLSVPALWWGWLAVADLSYTTSALWAGLGTGVVVLVVGVACGAIAFDRGGNRLMEFAETA